DIIIQVQPIADALDRRKWKHATSGIFTVKSAYSAMQERRSVYPLDHHTTEALAHLWQNSVPSKVAIFGWRLLLGRLPTRESLYNKGIINTPLDTLCVLCSNEVEDIHHLFFLCNVSQQVWLKIFDWMGIDPMAFQDVSSHFLCFGQTCKGKNSKRYSHIIWLATTWCMWNNRNSIIFQDDSFDVTSLVDHIMYIAWFWFIGRVGENSGAIFSDWGTNPRACFQSI
ncbi:putative ribonuclease H protein, partial [Trifolium medium]|nr:putative ribonuclease H protein [Trifolium medium]